MGIDNINDLNSTIDNISERRTYNQELSDIYKTMGLNQSDVVFETAQDINSTKTIVEKAALSTDVESNKTKPVVVPAATEFGVEDLNETNVTAEEKARKEAEEKAKKETEEKAKAEANKSSEKINKNEFNKWLEEFKSKSVGEHIVGDLGDIVDSGDFFASDIWSKIMAIYSYSSYLGKNSEAIKELEKNKTKIKNQEKGPFIIEFGNSKYSFDKKEQALNRIDEMDDWFEGTDGLSVQSGVEAIGNILSDIGGLGLDGLEFAIDTVNNTLQIIVEGTIIYLDYDFSDDQQTDYIIKSVLGIAQAWIIYTVYSKIKNPIQKGIEKAGTGLTENEFNKYSENAEKIKNLKDQYGISNSIESKLYDEAGTYQPKMDNGHIDYAKRSTRVYRNIKETLGSSWFTGFFENRVNNYSTSVRLKEKGGVINFLSAVINRGNKGKLNWKISSQSAIIKSASDEMGKNYDKISKTIGLIENGGFDSAQKDKLIKKLFSIYENSLVNHDKEISKFLDKEFGNILSSAELKKFMETPENTNPETIRNKENLHKSYTDFVETYPEINDNLEETLKEDLNKKMLVSGPLSEDELKTSFSKVLKDNGIDISYDEMKARTPGNVDIIKTDNIKNTFLGRFNELLGYKETVGEIDNAEKAKRYKAMEDFLQTEKTFSSKHFSAIIDIFLEGDIYDSANDTMKYTDVEKFSIFNVHMQNLSNTLRNLAYQINVGGVTPSNTPTPNQTNTSTQTTQQNSQSTSTNPNQQSNGNVAKAKKFFSKLNPLKKKVVTTQAPTQTQAAAPTTTTVQPTSTVSTPTQPTTPQSTPNSGPSRISDTIEGKIDAMTEKELGKKYTKFSNMLKSLEIELTLKGDLDKLSEIEDEFEKINSTYAGDFKSYLKDFYLTNNLDTEKNVAKYFTKKYNLKGIRKYDLLVSELSPKLSRSKVHKQIGTINVPGLLDKVKNTTIDLTEKTSILNSLKKFQFHDIDFTKFKL